MIREKRLDRTPTAMNTQLSRTSWIDERDNCDVWPFLWLRGNSTRRRDEDINTMATLILTAAC